MLEKETLTNVIDEITSKLESEQKISNFDLPGICNREGIGITEGDDSHFVHELLEVAVNNYISKRNTREMCRNDFKNKEILGELIKMESKLPPQSWRSDEQQTLQQFSTPPKIAFLMAKLLKPLKTDVILEPSAGTGSLASWMKIAGCQIQLNELSARRRALLEIQGYQPTPYNAEFIDDLLPDFIKPDGILMNPPFSTSAGRTKTGNSDYGFRHVKSALARLKDGGKLIALLGAETLTKTNKGLKFLSEITSENELKAIINLPKDAFYKYGTTYPTAIICVTKNKPQIKLTRSLTDILRIDCQTLEDVLEILDLFD